MREPYTQLYVHLVWSTWDRLPVLTEDIRARVYGCIQAECAALNAEAIAIGGVADHVHLLARFPATLSIAALTKQVKGASSHLAAQEARPGAFFKWQGGYSAFTIAKADVPRIRNYILNQEQHHREGNLDTDSEPNQ